MYEAEQPSVSKKTLVAIGVAGALGLGFLVGSLTSATPSFAQTPSSSSDSGSTSSDSGSAGTDPATPMPHHHGGSSANCPNVGGDSGSSSDSGSTASNSGASFGV